MAEATSPAKGLSSDATSKQKRCEDMYKMYHAKFPDVETLTSKEYLTSISTSASRRVLLVDVRSEPERDVSMIPGALTLAEFESRMKHENKDVDGNSSNAANANASASADPADEPVIVTYCTIGYRSGLEARRLRDTYSCKVLNLDGIVNYTHACAEVEEDGAANNSNNKNNYFNDNRSDGNHPKPMLVEPKTNKPTNRVHVFGADWNLAHDTFSPTYFSKPAMMLRGMGVIVSASFQNMQSTLCCCAKKPNRAKDD
jgi:rhodanese-related sulfurtransferase